MFDVALWDSAADCKMISRRQSVARECVTRPFDHTRAELGAVVADAPTARAV